MKYQLTDSDSFDSRLRDPMEKFQRRIQATPPGMCPVSMTLSMLQASRYQTCTKCVPCRDGLPVLEKFMQEILRGSATMETLEKLENTAQFISNTADCAIGYNTAKDVLKAPRNMLVSKADLEEETVDHMLEVLRKEFKEFETKE